MKNTPTILSSLALLGVIVLFILHFSNRPATTAKPAARGTTAPAATGPSAGRVAFIDIDTLEANYEFFKAKKADFTRRQAALESELESSARKLQSAATALQQKAQAGTLSQAEGEAEQRRLLTMQQSLEQRRQGMASQLMNEQDAFNADLKKRLDAFLAEYNKDKGYAYILSYSRDVPNILFADPALNITQDVIDGMNERDKRGGSAKTTDTAR